jgi:hypothetical protein
VPNAEVSEAFYKLINNGLRWEEHAEEGRQLALQTGDLAMLLNLFYTLILKGT